MFSVPKKIKLHTTGDHGSLGSTPSGSVIVQWIHIKNLYSEYHVIMYCPELRGEFVNHTPQFEPNFNKLNDDDIIVLFSQLHIYFFYTAKTCLNIHTVRRNHLYNTR